MTDWTIYELPGFLISASSGTREFGTNSYNFFIMDNFTFEASNTWLPWRGGYKKPLTNQISNIDDSNLKALVDNFDYWRSKLYQLNEKWMRLIIEYFDIPFPKTFHEWDSLRGMVDKHRNKSGASWMALSESKLLAVEMEQVVANINQLKLQIDKRMVEVYGNDILNIFAMMDEAFGDQRAKDLIDMTEGIPDSQPEKAIKLLNEALTYGETGIQASKAYLGLGMRYEDLDEIDTAIANYTKSFKADKPFSICLFWRGKLYFQQGKWLKAKSDFEQALELGELVSPEVEQAQDYLNQIQQNKNS